MRSQRAGLPQASLPARPFRFSLPCAEPRALMIDNLAILITCGAVVFVAFKAAILDARLPWFRPPRDHEAVPPSTGSSRR